MTLSREAAAPSAVDAGGGPAGMALTIGRLSVLPGVLLAAWLAVALPLLLIEALRPLPALVLAVPVMALAWRAAWRLTARTTHAAFPAGAPRWTVWSLLLISVAFALAHGILHAEKVILRRDASSYSQIGHWLAQHGALSVPTEISAFGGPDAAIGSGSAAFYERGDELIPQFMSGLPATLAAVEWVTGWAATMWVPAVLGGLALLAFGGLVARLVGPEWAPLGVLLLGAAQPFWHTARATFSEPLAAVLLIGGLCLLVDAMRADDRLAAALGGLLVGISTVVRVDALREAVLLVPFVGWLLLRGSPLARPLAAGLGIGLGYGVVDGLLLTRPYLEDIAESIIPLSALFAAVVAATALAVWLLRRRRFRAPGWLPTAGAWAVVAAAVAFAIRPLFQTAHNNTLGERGVFHVSFLQRAQGLPIDGDRTYDEWSLHWLAWWLGWATIALATVGAAIVVHRVLAGVQGVPPTSTGRRPEWIAPVLVGLGSAALTLWRPGISPDHPWADRRFVVIVLPGFVLFAVYATRWIYQVISQRWNRYARPAAAGLALAMLGPAVWASAPLLPNRVEAGSIDAIRTVCDALRPGDAVLLVDGRARQEWPSAVRGECGLPAATVPNVHAGVVDRLIARTKAAGRQPVLLAAESEQTIADLGFVPHHVVGLRTEEDQQLLTERPTRTRGLSFNVWISRP